MLLFRRVFFNFLPKILMYVWKQDILVHHSSTWMSSTLSSSSIVESMVSNFTVKQIIYTSGLSCNGYQSKHLQMETSTTRHRQTATSTNQNIDKQKLWHTKKSTNQKVDKKRRCTTKCVPFISFRHQYVLKLNIAVLCKYQFTIYIIVIQMKIVIGQLKSTKRKNENYYVLIISHTHKTRILIVEILNWSTSLWYQISHIFNYRNRK